MNTNIYSYLEIPVVQSSNPYVNVVEMWQLKTAVFLYRCLLYSVLLSKFATKIFVLVNKHVFLNTAERLKQQECLYNYTTNVFKNLFTFSVLPSIR